MRDALLRSGKALDVVDEVRVSYGRRGRPTISWITDSYPPCHRHDSVGGGIGFGGDVRADVRGGRHRFRDDKLDVLEHESYDLAPMEPSQWHSTLPGGRDRRANRTRP